MDSIHPPTIRNWKFLGNDVFKKMEVGAAVEKTAKIIAARTEGRFRILKAVVGKVAFMD